MERIDGPPRHCGLLLSEFQVENCESVCDTLRPSRTIVSFGMWEI